MAWGKVAFGPGIKAGGPNYVAQLMRFRSTAVPEGSTGIANWNLAELLELLSTPDEFTREGLSAADSNAICAAIRSYDSNYVREFGQQHDPSKLIGQDNIFRYLPVGDIRLRVHTDAAAFDLFARAAAAQVAGSRITVSYPPGGRTSIIDVLEHVTEAWVVLSSLSKNRTMNWRPSSAAGTQTGSAIPMRSRS